MKDDLLIATIVLQANDERKRERTRGRKIEIRVVIYSCVWKGKETWIHAVSGKITSRNAVTCHVTKSTRDFRTISFFTPWEWLKFQLKFIHARNLALLCCVKITIRETVVKFGTLVLYEEDWDYSSFHGTIFFITRIILKLNIKLFWNWLNF